MRNASEYDVYIPLTYNDGTHVDTAKIDALKRRLHERFGGLTFFPQKNEGMWKIGAVTFRDEIVVLRILSEEVRESREFFLALKDELKAEFRQEEVLIVERKVEVL
jgi:hypothetical protein